MDWTREAGALESYGHDIECSWLMHEAALVLGDQAVLDKVEPIVKLVAKASEKGLNADGSMVHEANLDTGYVDDDRHWWVQAETVVGFINLYQHFGDESALQKALHCWQYIKDNLIDREGCKRRCTAGNTSRTTSSTARAASGSGVAMPRATSTAATTRRASANTANMSSPTRRRRGPGSTTWATRISSH